MMSQWRNNVSYEGRQTQEGQNQEEPSSSSPCVTSREKRRLQRLNRSKTKELSEEEMMDLALQLSQQEASVAAVQLQRREEEDVMKAIRESMILQAHRAQSPTLHTNEETSGRTCSPLPSINRTILLDDEKSSSSEMQQTSRQSGDKSRAPDGSLQKKTNLVQPLDLNLELESPGSCDVLDSFLHSPQSSDSTVIDDTQPSRSPVFPSTCCRAEIVLPRLSQDLVQSCKTSGFVLCSLESVCNGAKNPTCQQRSRHSQCLSEKGQGDAGDPEPCGFNYCSQDSLSSSVTSASSRSPVFPRTGPSSSEMGQTETSVVFQVAEELPISHSPNKTQIDAAALSPSHQTKNVSTSPGSGMEVTTTGNLDDAQLSSNMTLCWSDEDGEVMPVASPSPVFLAETQQAALQPTRHNCRQELSIPEAQPISNPAAQGGMGHPVQSGPTVHYYWGIPFCPRGLDPDKYTQVIVAQMEVFEKSLKEAQRNLLRKAEWAEGIEPQPEGQQENSQTEFAIEESEDLLPRRHLRRKKRSCPSDSPSAGTEDENQEVKVVEQRERCKEGAVAEEEMETEDTEVPETQLNIDDEDECTEALIEVQDIRVELKSDKPPEIPMIVLESSPAEEESMEEEAAVAEAVRQTEKNSPERRSSPVGPPLSDEEVHRQDGASPAQEIALDVQQVSVDCPICQGSFPADEIEMHAAYCDGAPSESPPEVAVPVLVKSQRKRKRRFEADDQASNPAPSTSRELMKCFICQLEIHVQDYGRHTDLCISRQDAASAGKKDLLSALEKTESPHSGIRSCGSRRQNSDFIDLRNDEGVPGEEGGDEVGGVSSINISNSPIRSFTPISEAKDCLIDFRRARHPKKLGRRRR